MSNTTAPIGFDNTLWNLAAIITAIQSLQAQTTPVTQAQLTALQQQITQTHAGIGTVGATPVQQATPA